MVARIQAALTLYLFAALGVFLLAIPWTSIWDQVALALLPRALSEWVSSGWVKGIVSGLGVLDLAAATRDAGSLWRDLGSSDPGEPS